MAEIKKIQPIGSSTQYDLSALKIYTTYTSPTSSTQSFFVPFVNSSTNNYQDLRLNKALTFWEDPESSKNCALVIGDGSSGYAGELDITSSTNKELALKPAAMTANRTITFPDASGTVLLANGTGAISQFLRGDNTWSNTLEGSGGSTLIQLVNTYNNRTDRNLWLVSSNSMGLMHTPAKDSTSNLKWIIRVTNDQNVITSDYPLYLQNSLTIGNATYGDCLNLYTNGEGGNIYLRCAGSNGVASNTGYEIDTAGNNLRLFRTTNNGANATRITTLMDADGTLTAQGYFISNCTNVGEAHCEAISNAGRIYLYSQMSATGNRGIYGFNASGTGQSMFGWTQDGKIYAGGALYGAVWNDYAEFRETKEEIEPGRCIREVGDDTLVLTTKRLQRGCEIVSDTFGFAIGQSKKCKTPTAASGRVLAYPYESLDEFKKHIGYCVCSGPNGTVSIMTEKEEKEYPGYIIGTISAVPDYETWNAGTEENPEEIKVNGRVWIRVR